MAFPNTLKYKQLKHTNEEYSAERILKNRLLFQGGQEILDNAKLFIKKGLETSLAYDAKLTHACYKNNFGNIINDFSATLFTHQVLIHPTIDDVEKTEKQLEDIKDSIYSKFESDADNKGNSFNYVLSEHLITSMYQTHAYIGVDFPKPQDKPENKLIEEKEGLDKPYCFLIPTEAVLDWACDDYGNFDFIVLKKEYNSRKNITDDPTIKTVEFKIWQKLDNGTIEYGVYSAKETKGNRINDETDFNLDDENVTDFKDIPVICLELPSQLHIGSLIGTLATSCFSRYTDLLFAESQALVAIPFLKMGAEFPSDDSLSEIGSNPNRKNDIRQQLINKGFAVGGPDDELEFKEPNGAAYSIVYGQIQDDIDAMYHIVNQMGNSVSQNSNIQSRSGVSKIMDQQAKEHALSAYGYVVKQVALKIYYLISEAKNEDIVWAAHGLDNYHLEDRDLLIKEAAQINLINIPSDTFKTLYLTETAIKLLETESPGQAEIIKEEIKKGLKEFNMHQEETLNPVKDEPEDDEDE